MTLLSTSHCSSSSPSSLFFSKIARGSATKTTPSIAFSHNVVIKSLLFRPTRKQPSPRFPPLLTSLSDPSPAPDPDQSPKASITDEWGDKVEEGAKPELPKAADSDPPRYEDEWGEGGEEYVELGNGPAGAGVGVEKDDKVGDLKRALVDTFYATEFGFRASPEVRAEVSELVNQLEALNPTPSPVEASALLDGNWVLLYTAFSELLPLLALSNIPLLKVEKISQEINTSTRSIVNATALSSPFATISFSASATFEVCSPSRIQVQFKEGSFQPPEIKSTVSLPENVDVFGQTINLAPIQQSLNPLQEAVANISRTISGQPPLKVPIPGDRTRSWLLITYLDEDLRISRGDGGLFILAKEGSPLLNL